MFYFIIIIFLILRTPSLSLFSVLKADFSKGSGFNSQVARMSIILKSFTSIGDANLFLFVKIEDAPEEY